MAPSLAGPREGCDWHSRPLAALTLLLLLANHGLLNLSWMDLGKLNENSLIICG